MTEQLQPIDLNTRPDLLAVVDEVVTTRHPRQLQRNGENVAEINPVAQRRRRSPSKARPVTRDDPLFGLIGIGNSGGSNVAQHKHEYLAEAYREHLR